MKVLTVVDIYGFFFRSYYALPKLTSKSGFPTGLLTGFTNLISGLGTEFRSDYIIFASESKERNFRKDIDENYKANRPEAPEELKQQLPVALEWIEKMGFKTMSVPSFEADDVIATLAHVGRDMDFEIRIVSHDKDLYQLIEDGLVHLYDPIKKKEINESECVAKYGIRPSQFVDYQSLVGDSSDNVPGVKGVGAKTAQKLIAAYESLEGVYDNIDNIESKRLRELLLQDRESAFRSRELVRLRDDCFEGLSLDEMVYPTHNPLLKITDELLALDIRSVVERIKKEPLKEASSLGEYEAITLLESAQVEKVLGELEGAEVVAFDTETDALDVRSANIVGFSFCFDDTKAYYMPLAHNYLGVEEQLPFESGKRVIEAIFAKKLIGHNLKFDLAVVKRCFGLEMEGEYEDTMILAWLMNPESAVGLDGLAKREFGHKMLSFKETVKKGENFGSVNIDEASVYACEDAYVTLKLYHRLQEAIQNSYPRLLEIAKEVEFPFIKVLLNMESLGIKLDIPRFVESKETLEQTLARLREEIYGLAEGEFNINSTQQLSDILFNRLKLPPSKKTKSGYSTDEKVLRKLEGTHAIIAKILEYRELFKLKSTYLEPLIKYAKKDKESRIYTSFTHTGTATGRLSSKNPNLQNIPVKSELGRKIREGFIAKKSCVLVSIDYSQIELRLLAHFSGDEALIKAFMEDKDIHYETALRLFGTEEAKEKRNIAKSINFGLIYGMGSRKLSEQLGIPPKEAKAYIESYFESFPTVKGFLEHSKEIIKERGYSQTLLGRRRYFNFNNVAPFQEAGFLREGVNTIFQGSAADLIKCSMNEIHKRAFAGCDMLLQVHDELIFEVKSEDAKHLSNALKTIMEQIHPLKVPLQCGVSIGGSWGALK